MADKPKKEIEEIRRKRRFHIYLILIVAVVVANFPIVWLAITSFQPTPTIIDPKPHWIFDPTLEHYVNLLTRTGDFNFLRDLLNSVIVTVSTTIVAMLISYPAAYSISRYKTGGDNFSFWVLSIRMLPPIVFLIPISILFALYHLTDTKLGLVLLYLTFNVPFATWIIKSFIDDIPVDLERAAYLDGYSRFAVMRKVIFPLTRPAVVSVAIICFIFSWNEFLYALVISFENATTLTAGAARFFTAYGIQWGNVAAATIVAIIPTIIVGFVGQRYLVRGLTMGAVK